MMFIVLLASIFTLVLPVSTQEEIIIDVRLAGNNVKSEGQLEVSFEGEWIPVCYRSDDHDDIDWSNQAAWVACRQLGYHGGRRKSYDGFSVESTLKVKNVRCGNGFFLRLQGCSFEIEEVNCEGNRQAGVECFENLLDIRLISDSATIEGRLEMFYKDQWIPICNDGDELGDREWNNQAAWVACRQLGYYGGRRSSYEYDYDFSEDHPVKVNDVRCKDGLYQHLQECFFEIEDINCDDRQQAGVQCVDKPLQVRLIQNRTKLAGKLEIAINDRWYPVCSGVVEDEDDDDDRTWNNQAAWVACRQLGYNGGRASRYDNPTLSDREKINDVRCGDGLYSSLQECFFEIQDMNCNRQAGVECFEFSDIDPQIRLAKNATKEGRLEMYIYDEWVAVCYQGDESDDREWNDETATVACRQLGYDGGKACYFLIGNDDPTGRKANDVRCGDGSYGHLRDCFFEIQRRVCRDNYQAGVKCFDNVEIVTTRTSLGTKTTTGRFSTAIVENQPLKSANGSTGAIVGGAVGAVIIIIIVIMVLICIITYRRQNNESGIQAIASSDNGSVGKILHRNPAYEVPQPSTNDSNVNESSLHQNNEYAYVDGIKTQATPAPGGNDEEYAYPETPGKLSLPTNVPQGWKNNTIYVSSDEHEIQDVNNQEYRIKTNDPEEGWADNSVYGT